MALDISSTAQSRRGQKSGRVRRGKVKARDKRILALVQSGLTQPQTARRCGCSLRTVEYVLRRDR